MEQLLITLAKESDLTHILELQKVAYVQEAEIYNDFSIQPLNQTLTDLRLEWQNGTILKAVKEDEIIGAVRAHQDGDVCKIGKLIVKPDYQNQGIGKLLMLEIERQFDGCATYELFTGHKSEKNLALYKKLGYQKFKEEVINEDLKLVFLSRSIRNLKHNDCEKHR
ncbi:GNAT family N-acetyltransferase [Fulvivirga ligni]|uniref:GNAT family N-acetyltransferase n=1 Tax=Fulvivirga ligni TaxID=2904246 RepID=UPI001F32FE04|nr:GNAT family N-acetyltransferase [Fulvivirga ligni]UII20517.1 GNAT family N-acetyltransferase [Fulvivirga ligni]